MIFWLAPDDSSRKRVKVAIPPAREGLPGIIKSREIPRSRTVSSRSTTRTEVAKLWHSADEIFCCFDQRIRPGATRSQNVASNETTRRYVFWIWRKKQLHVLPLSATMPCKLSSRRSGVVKSDYSSASFGSQKTSASLRCIGWIAREGFADGFEATLAGFRDSQ